VKLLHTYWERSNLLSDLFFAGETNTQGGAATSVYLGEPPTSFDLLAFTLPDERNYLDAVSFLSRHSLPARARERDQGAPILIAGGPAVMANPFPVLPFFDLMCVGEIECLVPDVARELADSCWDRAALVSSLTCLSGFMDPRAPRQTKRRWSTVIGHPRPDVLADIMEPGGYVPVETARGCTNRCSFCLIPQIFGPYREAAVPAIVGHVEGALACRPDIQAVRFTAPSPLDHSGMDDILAYLRREGLSISLGSARVDRLLHNTRLQNLLSGSVCLGVEVGHEARRRELGKRFPNSDVVELCRQLSATEKVTRIAFNLLIGLPSETVEEIDATIALVRDAAEACDRPAEVSISVLVPEPLTALGQHPMMQYEKARDHWDRLAHGLHGTASVSPDNRLDAFYLSGVFSKGGPELADVILLASCGNLTFDSPLHDWDRCFSAAGLRWEAILYSAGVCTCKWYAGRAGAASIPTSGGSKPLRAARAHKGRNEL